MVVSQGWLSVLPRNHKDHYDALKVFACVRDTVASEMKTLATKKNLSIGVNVILQMECKMDGERAVGVPIPVNNLVVIVIDMYCDTLRYGRSVAALIASVNNTCTHYYTCT